MFGSDSTIRRIRKLSRALAKCSPEDLRERGLKLKYLASTGFSLTQLIPKAYSLVIESSRRSLGMVPYDVQIYGAIQIANGYLAEMKTGEGKTITATMPVYLNALAGKGVHVATSNDYLAQRDAEEMRLVYELLGLTVGVVHGESTPDERKAAYRCDVTYGTAKEFGFDFLRDRLQILAHGNGIPASQLAQRGLNYALVDEADSILIDEARTPLIIGVSDSEEAKIENGCFRWAAKFADRFVEETHFTYDHTKRKIELTSEGKNFIRQLPQTGETQQVGIRALQKNITDAIKVRRDFHNEKNYVVRDGKVEIVDEFTGRVAEGRKWQDGIHQSIEAKEAIEITARTRHGATITLQSFFRKYAQFAGMTGTAWTSRSEFKKVYEKRVIRIPTNRPVNRKQLPFQVYLDLETKMQAVVEETKRMLEQNRAVLIGTRSIEKSETLAKILSANSVPHHVLNANNLESEAEIVAAAGQPGRVTVATNMAGRGTDILLSDEVRSAGGLHVILTELHESQRIDWQLIGRGSRQGDPGSFRIFVALDDELLTLGLGPAKAAKLAARYSKSNRSSSRLPREVFGYFKKAQRTLERKYLVDRMVLRRQDKEKHERQFELGLDPYCQVVR